MKANRKTDICIFTIRSRVKHSATAFQLNKMSLISTVSRFIHALSYKWNHIIVLPYSVFLSVSSYYNITFVFVVILLLLLLLLVVFVPLALEQLVRCALFFRRFFLLNLFVWFATRSYAVWFWKKLPVNDLQNGIKWMFTKEFPLHCTCYAIIAISFMP